MQMGWGTWLDLRWPFLWGGILREDIKQRVPGKLGPRQLGPIYPEPKKRNLWQECGFLDKDTLNYIDVTTWWSSLYGQRGDGEQQDWRRWKKSPVKIQHWLPIHLMLWSLKHLRFPQLPSSEGGKGGRFLFLLISVVKLMCYCAPFQSKDKFLQK